MTKEGIWINMGLNTNGTDWYYVFLYTYNVCKYIDIFLKLRCCELFYIFDLLCGDQFLNTLTFSPA